MADATSSGSGTPDDPWRLKTPPLSSEYTLHRDTKDGTDVLFRIDDELVPVRSLLRALHPAVVSRIKVLGGMNLAEHRRPQDGRTTYVADDGARVDLRISVLPAVFGERTYVEQVYWPDLVAIAGFYKDWAAIGEVPAKKAGV